MAQDRQLEKGVETFFRDEVKRRGGLATKMIPVIAGLPDRLALLPGGRFLLVELKRPRGGVYSAVQDAMHERLRRMGFIVHRVKNRSEVLALLNSEKEMR